MLYLAIPAHNEAATIGVLLWRLRTVLAEFPREYEAVVYDDASTDSTADILESYSKVMPLTVLRGERQVGYAGAVNALVRHVSRDTRYPRRDAMLLLQGDFTDSPSIVPEFVKRFEGGTDIVVGERSHAVRRRAPTPVRRLLAAEPWLLRFFVGAHGLRDLTSSYRLVRISVLRELLRVVGDAPVCAGDSRTANVDFLLRVVPLARRVEALPVEPTWDVRLRDTRVVAMADGMSLLRWAWSARGRRVVPSTAPEAPSEPLRPVRAARVEREGRAELRLEGRSERQVETVLTAAGESTRGSVSRDARPPRKVRPPRPLRPETTVDARLELTAIPIERASGESAFIGLPAAEEEVEEPLENAQLPPREPARRKRTRRARGNRAVTAADAVSGTADDALTAVPAEFTNEAPVLSLLGELKLSPELSAAVEDVEAELEPGERRRPSRKKRRRRGARGGSVNGLEGAEERLRDDGEPAASENPTTASTADGPRASDEERSAYADDDVSDIGGEERARRRSRRGRRGGSRRRGQHAEEGDGGPSTSDE